MPTRSRRSSTTICLAAACLLAAASPAPAQVIARISGTVTDDAGTPIEGVEVSLKDATTNAQLKAAKTNKKGKYLYMVEAGGYYFVVKHPSYILVRTVAELINQDGQRSVRTFFYDDKQEFDKPDNEIRVHATGDITSKSKNQVDFIVASPDKHAAVVNKMYAEYRGGKPGEGSGGEGGTGPPPAPPPPEETKKTPYEIATDLIARNDYAGAIPHLKEAGEKDPTNPDVFYQLGKAAIEGNNDAEAEPALKKAKELDPAKPGVNFYLARWYDKKGRKVQALQALEEERALSPDSEVVLDNLAGLYLDTGQADKAIAAYEALIGLNPDHLDAYMSLATLYKEAGDRAKEEDTYRRLGDRDPTGDALYNLGTLAFNRSEADKAVAYYKKVLEKNPSHAKAHLQLGYSLVNMADFAGAVKEFETFLKLSPKDAKAGEARKMIDELKKLLPAAKAGG